ncbi:MAG TPA: sialidase family protein, partial [Gemmatimonadales bacterium]|nr:sialidase family protein [Gemmatimonadales bacterium]
QDAWQTVIEIRPPERGVSARDGELALGPAGEVALIYRWWRHEPRAKQIRLARSDDGGKTWIQASTPVDTSGKTFDPRVAWSKGKSLVVVWADERRGDRHFDIYARRSPDGGMTWEAEQLLSRFPRNGPSDLHARPQLLSDGGDRLWAVWVGVRNSKSFLFMNRSLDGGRTWTEPVPLSGESRSVFGQTLLGAGDRMLLTWQDSVGGQDRIYAVSSSDSGVTWTTPVRVDHLPAGAPPATGATALLGQDGEALVAWQDARNGRDDIFLARSTDGGRTWSKDDQRMDMDEPGTAFSRAPKLAKSPDGRVALTWEDDRAGFEAVYARIRSAGQKAEWGPELPIAPPTGKIAARIPNLAWGPGGLYIVWQAWDHTLAPARTDKTIVGRTVSPDKP